ncbi:MAG: SDR family NAD(P)-dependent oxidoreductase [Dehalococcoidales bacterium]|nr:SDR family NAD(P)-dependent oxidoreductase [Dehalococcoidales bacterium]
MSNLPDTAPLTMHHTGLARDSLAGDVAVVTGGAGNIGLGVSRSLAWLGARVVIAGRNAETGQAAADFIDNENKPGTALYVQTDVADESSMNAMAEKAFAAFGKVDILVNNAMNMTLGGPVLDTSPPDMDRQYEVAVRGALLGIQAFVPGMVERRHGVVTYIATTFRYPSGPSTYCAVKSATSSLMMSLAAELGPVQDTGVSVFQFVPTIVGRPRQPESSRPRPGTFVAPPVIIGYGSGPIPPEDCGAALSYCIVHAADIHGSGVNASQAMKRMNWPFPNPESVPGKDFDRIRDQVLVRMFGYVGPGWPDRIEPLESVNRSEAPPNEPPSTSALF